MTLIYPSIYIICQFSRCKHFHLMVWSREQHTHIYTIPSLGSWQTANPSYTLVPCNMVYMFPHPNNIKEIRYSWSDLLLHFVFISTIKNVKQNECEIKLSVDFNCNFKHFTFTCIFISANISQWISRINNLNVPMELN